MADPQDQLLRSALDKAQSAITILIHLGADYEELMLVAQTLLAVGAERLQKSDVQVVAAVKANVPLIRTLVEGTKWGGEDTEQVRSYVDPQSPHKKIILP
ncbi:MAG: hypothetical protein GY772_29500 [bacterium]|nr:hypothetical protein [bacterium]